MNVVHSLLEDESASISTKSDDESLIDSRKPELTYLYSPVSLQTEVASTDSIKSSVYQFRREISDVLHHRSHKWLAIVGPCSIHNAEEALLYARRLKQFSQRVSDHVIVVMRVYLEKPRTVLGWKGFLKDPDMNGSMDVRKGLLLSRSLLLEISKLNLPIACEFLDPIAANYLSDLVSWGAIGARTSESQIHRELAASLDIPIGFKNNTQGHIEPAIDSIVSSRSEHTFLSISQSGVPCCIRGRGNPDTHLVLRGGSRGPNYDEESIKRATKLLELCAVDAGILVDCSHGNSGKDYRNQRKVLQHIAENQSKGSCVKGIMLESNINEGNQAISKNIKYGVSVTDGCIGWDETEELLMYLHETLQSKNQQ